MQYVNLTPHAIHLNDGRVFPPSGIVARVSATFVAGTDPDLFRQVFGAVENLPAATTDTRLIVSAIVLSAVGDSRPDVVAPATGHPDCVREPVTLPDGKPNPKKGQIVSVPGFVRG